MDDLLAARLQMAFTLGFHIIFAAIGMAMPFFMATSHYLYLRSGEAQYKVLTKAWSKGVAIFFAVGAVSGTALSFELGLLWPGFMKYAGPIIGMPFSWEGTAFFLEAIALGIFLYGWNRIPPWTHWASGVMVGISGLASAYFVICANSWMNYPVGFKWNDGNPSDIDPFAAMFHKGALLQGTHMVVAAFEAVGFAVCGLHALLFLKTGLAIHKRAVVIPFIFAAAAALIQPLVGDLTAKMTAERQPLKLAAMEALFKTQTSAPLLVGGIPDVQSQEVHYGIELPGLLSFLAYGDFAAEVKGLEEFPREHWPPVAVVHYAFQVMVGLGTVLAGLSAIGLFFLWRKSPLFFRRRWFVAMSVCIPLGFIALEAGWIVTEVGRQPWIIYGLLKVSDSLTPRPGVVFTLGTYPFLYAFLALLVLVLMTRQIKSLHASERGGGSEY